jgi:uncharacterized protein (DUF697 family)
MKLPIDIGALISAATDINAAKETPVSLSVYISIDAPAKLAAYARNIFASAASHVRMTIAYLDNFEASHCKDEDFVVIVAGESDIAGVACAAVRCAGTPCVVLAPTSYTSEGEYAVPEGDLIVVNDYEQAALDKVSVRIGEWIAEVCPAKRLSFALAFPFVARPLANEVVRATAMQNAGIGAVVILPGADMPLMTLNQAKMILEIAAAYGQAITKDRIPEILAVVGGGFAARSVARNVVGVVPALGWAIKGTIGYTATYAMGKAAIEYFENGAGVSGVGSMVTGAAEKGASLAKRVKGVLYSLTTRGIND